MTERTRTAFLLERSAADEERVKVNKGHQPNPKQNNILGVDKEREMNTRGTLGPIQQQQVKEKECLQTRP